MLQANLLYPRSRFSMNNYASINMNTVVISSPQTQFVAFGSDLKKLPSAYILDKYKSVRLSSQKTCFPEKNYISSTPA